MGTTCNIKVMKNGLGNDNKDNKDKKAAKIVR